MLPAGPVVYKGLVCITACAIDGWQAHATMELKFTVSRPTYGNEL